MSSLYHKDVFIPPFAQKPVFEGILVYTQHARHAAKSDRFGVIDLPVVFRSKEAQLVEAEVSDDGILIKQVWRQKFNHNYDLILVITRQGCVKTVWLNSNRDKHRTLNTSNYVQPSKQQRHNLPC